MRCHLKPSRRMNRQPHTVDASVTLMEAQCLVETTKDLRRNNRELVSRGSVSAKADKCAVGGARGLQDSQKVRLPGMSGGSG